MRERALPPLPSLELLEWGIDSVSIDTVALFDIFLTSRTTHLRINTVFMECATSLPYFRRVHPSHLGTPIERCLSPSLKTLAIFSPKLKHLSLDVWGTVDLFQALPDIISTLGALEVLDLSLKALPISPRILASFGSLRNLRLRIDPFSWNTEGLSPDVRHHLGSLGLERDYEGWLSPLVHPRITTPIVLSFLETMILEVGNPKHFASFLGCVQLPSLVSSTLISYGGRHMQETLTALGACSDQRTLRVIQYINLIPQVTRRYHWCTESSDASSAFLPLWTYENLEVLAFDGVDVGGADDALICKISESWPRLRELSFGSHLVGDNYEITLDGIMALLRGCPDLRTLRLSTLR